MDEQREGDDGNDYAERAAGAREHQRVGDVLSHQMPSGGAQGCPNRELPGARCVPCDEQPGDVRTGDEEHEPD